MAFTTSEQTGDSHFDQWRPRHGDARSGTLPRPDLRFEDAQNGRTASALHRAAPFPRAAYGRHDRGAGRGIPFTCLRSWRGFVLAQARHATEHADVSRMPGIVAR